MRTEALRDGERGRNLVESVLECELSHDATHFAHGLITVLPTRFV